MFFNVLLNTTIAWFFQVTGLIIVGSIISEFFHTLAGVSPVESNVITGSLFMFILVCGMIYRTYKMTR